MSESLYGIKYFLESTTFITAPEFHIYSDLGTLQLRHKKRMIHRSFILVSEDSYFGMINGALTNRSCFGCNSEIGIPKGLRNICRYSEVGIPNREIGTFCFKELFLLTDRSHFYRIRIRLKKSDPVPTYIFLFNL